MGIEKYKISESEISDKKISALPDRPNSHTKYGEGGMSATELKKRFDELGLYIIEKFNAFLDTVNSDGSDSESIAAMINTSIFNGHTLSDLFADVKDGTFSTYLRVENEGALKSLASIINELESLASRVEEKSFSSVSYDKSSGRLVLITGSGDKTEMTLEIPPDMQSMRSAEYKNGKLIFEKNDGSAFEVDISELINEEISAPTMPVLEGDAPNLRSGNLIPTNDGVCITEIVSARQTAGSEIEVISDRATIKSFSGLSVHQMIKNGDFKDLTGWKSSCGALSVDSHILKFLCGSTSGGTSYYNGRIERSDVYMQAGHKYFVVADVKPKYTNKIVACASNGNSSVALSDYFTPVANKWNRFCGFITPYEDCNTLWICIDNIASNYRVGDIVYFSKVRLIDLTAASVYSMNESDGSVMRWEDLSILEMRRIIGEHYFEGTRHSTVQKIITTGKNILPNSFDYEYLSLSTGKSAYDSSGMYIATKDYTYVLPQTTYSFQVDFYENSEILIDQCTVCYYDEYFNYLGCNDIEGAFNTPSGCRYIKIMILFMEAYEFDVTKLVRCSVNIGSVNLGYEEYVENEMSFSSPIELKSVGGWKDKADFENGKITRYIGEHTVDASTDVYAVSGDSYIDIYVNDLSVYDVDSGNLVIALSDPLPDGVISYFADFGYVRINLDYTIDESDLSELTEFFDGYKIYYPLYEPVTEAIDQENRTYVCDNYGIERIVNSENGIDTDISPAICMTVSYDENLKQQILTNAQNIEALKSALSVASVSTTSFRNAIYVEDDTDSSQADWDERDRYSPKYINNKPPIPKSGIDFLPPPRRIYSVEGSTLNIEDNTEYRLSGVKDLTIVLPDASVYYSAWIKLNTADSDANIRFSDNAVYVDSVPVIEGGRTYVIEIKDGIVCVKALTGNTRADPVVYSISMYCNISELDGDASITINGDKKSLYVGKYTLLWSNIPATAEVKVEVEENDKFLVYDIGDANDDLYLDGGAYSRSASISLSENASGMIRIY